MARKVKGEWVGKNDNAMPPASVRQRILERENNCCHICNGLIASSGWHADHVPPLKDGGENREGMIKPAHAKCHRVLTAKQAIERAPIERKKMKHSGAIRPKGSLGKRPKEKREGRLSLPPRQLFKEK